MKQKLFAILVFTLFASMAFAQQDRAIRDTGGATTEHDTSATFHVRLTFGDEYSLSLATLDTADIISIYGGAQTGNPSTITLPELGSTGKYDGKWIHIRGSASGEAGAAPFVITHETTPTDILVLHQQTGSKKGNDTIYSTYGDNYRYYISNDRYYRYAQAPVVWQKTNVTNLTKADGQVGDIAINAAKDTIAFFAAYYPWVILVPVGGAAAPSTSFGIMYGSDTGDSFVTTGWTKITGGAISGATLGDWTFNGTLDRLEYSGVNGVYYKVDFHIAGFVANSNLVTITVNKNTTATRAISKVDMLNTGTRHQMSGSDILSFNNGDYLEIGGQVNAVNTTFDTSTLQLVVSKVVGQ